LAFSCVGKEKEGVEGVAKSRGRRVPNKGTEAVATVTRYNLTHDVWGGRFRLGGSIWEKRKRRSRTSRTTSS